MSELSNMEKILREQGYLIRPISGISMLPMLEEKKDAVKLIPTDRRLKKYELPLYRRKNGDLVLHRVVKVRKNYYITCGDNSLELEKVTPEQIIAVAEGYFKDGKYISCDDAEYMRYVRAHCRKYYSREIIRPVRIPDEWRAIVLLFRMAVAGKTEKLDMPQINWERMLAISKQHMIAATLYPAVRAQDLSEEIMTKWRAMSDRALKREILFDAEREAIFAQMEERGIKYLPLKGILLKELYPMRGMREFSDNDILFDAEKAEQLRTVMTERGYENTEFGNIHDTYLKKPIYNFEMHRKLFGNELQKHFSDVWSRAVKDEGNLYGYHMRREELYLHVLAHLYKHYCRRGAGIRYFFDVILLRKSMLERGFDAEYLKKRVGECGLCEFEELVLATSEELMHGDISNIPFETLSYIFDSGVYGQIEHRVENDLKKKGKIKYLFGRVFLPYSNMKKLYPTLKRAPFLLPVFWAVRIISALFFKNKRRRVVLEMNVLRNTDTE